LEWLHQHEPKKTSLRSDLSEKDREILEHLQEGKTGAEIVQELGVHRVEVTRARRREATRRLQEGEEVEVVARELGLSEKDLEQLTKQPRLL
jgi:DNA-binding NarL/FixJ family response regulator